MNIHEYQAKEILARFGVPVPNGALAKSPQEAENAAQNLGGNVVLKAQVHAGGRSLGGGIKVVASPGEAGQMVQSMLGKRLVTPQTDVIGVPVNAVLVEELADIRRELYMAITVDAVQRCPVVLASSKGGIDIEALVAADPGEVITEPIDPTLGPMPFQYRRLADNLGLGPSVSRQMHQIVDALYRIFIDNDCTLLEINPLVVTADDQLLALDAKIILEDDSLFRHAKLLDLRDRSQEDELEARATDLDISYVNLDGDVGCLVNGAGLAMATLDATTSAGATPANFLDVGGGATPDKVASAVDIILSDLKVNKVLVNIFGGILRCDIAAHGVVQGYQNKNVAPPIVARLLGTNVEEGKTILRDSGLQVTFAETLGEAVRALDAV